MTQQVKEAMRRDIREGRQTAEGLRTMLEKNLATTYGVSRDTARKARITVLSEFFENSNSSLLKIQNSRTNQGELCEFRR